MKTFLCIQLQHKTMCTFLAYDAFHKATDGQTDIKHEKDERYCWSSSWKASSLTKIELRHLKKMCTLFCLVYMTKRSFFTCCVFWFVFLNATSHLCFQFFFPQQQRVTIWLLPGSASSWLQILFVSTERFCWGVNYVFTDHHYFLWRPPAV